MLRKKILYRKMRSRIIARVLQHGDCPNFGFNYLSLHPHTGESQTGTQGETPDTEMGSPTGHRASSRPYHGTVLGDSAKESVGFSPEREMNLDAGMPKHGN